MWIIFDKIMNFNPSKSLSIFFHKLNISGTFDNDLGLRIQQSQITIKYHSFLKSSFSFLERTKFLDITQLGIT